MISRKYAFSARADKDVRILAVTFLSLTPRRPQSSSIPTTAADVPSKQACADLDSELASLRQQLRLKKRRVQALRVGLTRLTSSLTAAAASTAGITAALTAGEDTIGASLHDTVSAVVMGKDGLRQLKGEGEKLLAGMDGEGDEENVQVKGNAMKVGGDLGGLNQVLGGR